MYLRISTVRRKSHVYRSAQIVESYRREDGTPTNRIIASLGPRTDDEIAAIRAVLDIARKGGRPVLDAKRVPQAQVLKSLRYLDAAVLLKVWRESGLHALVAEVLGTESSTVPAIDVVVALVLQRCLAPASKLAASRWFPTTALPELLGVDSERFNNSRVHRVLTKLEGAEAALQQRLPAHLNCTNGSPSLLLLDATDTWFEGHGPPMAGKDKEGVYRRRVGLVLVCNEQGLPYRWHTLEGRYHDATSLGAMACELAQLPWAKQATLVVDRALGNANWVEKLDQLQLRYLTCVPSPEYESCGAPIPWDVIDGISACGDKLAAIQEHLVAAGFQHDGDQHYVRELGVFDKSRPRNSTSRISEAQSALRTIEVIEASTDKARELAVQLKLEVRSVHRYRPLLALTHEVRECIRRGDADALRIAQLHELAALPPEQQLAALKAMVSASSVPFRRARKARMDALPLQVRAALSVNPRRVLDDRKNDEARLTRVREQLADVNRRLASPHSQRSDASALAEVERCIRKNSLGNVCSTNMDKQEHARQVVLHFDDKAWQRRRRTDGISLVISHPNVAGTACERVARYFAKDAVEKDFQSVKSVLGLRPIRHRTDPKLRAHITICILALLLTRLVEQKLSATTTSQTLAALVESLEPVRLNLIAPGTTTPSTSTDACYYTVTHSSEAIKTTLEVLGMLPLVDDAAISKEIRPR